MVFAFVTSMHLSLRCGWAEKKQGTPASQDSLVQHTGIARALMESDMETPAPANAPGGRSNADLGERAWGDNTVGDNPDEPAQGAGIYAAILQSQIGGTYSGDHTGHDQPPQEPANEPSAGDRLAREGLLSGTNGYMGLNEREGLGLSGGTSGGSDDSSQHMQRITPHQLQNDLSSLEREAKVRTEIEKFNPESMIRPVPHTAEYQIDSRIPEALRSNPQWVQWTNTINRDNWCIAELQRIWSETNARGNLSSSERAAMLKKIENAKDKVYAEQCDAVQKANAINDVRMANMTKQQIAAEAGEGSDMEDVRESMMNEEENIGREDMGREAPGNIEEPQKQEAEPPHGKECDY